METIQTYGQWQLNKYSQLKYFKNGRSNMHVAVSYCIEHTSRFTLPCDDVNRVETGTFWIRTKGEAMREWRQFKATHSLGGCALRAELFPVVSHE